MGWARKQTIILPVPHSNVQGQTNKSFVANLIFVAKCSYGWWRTKCCISSLPQQWLPQQIFNFISSQRTSNGFCYICFTTLANPIKRFAINSDWNKVCFPSCADVGANFLPIWHMSFFFCLELIWWWKMNIFVWFLTRLPDYCKFFWVVLWIFLRKFITNQ